MQTAQTAQTLQTVQFFCSKFSSEESTLHMVCTVYMLQSAFLAWPVMLKRRWPWLYGYARNPLIRFEMDFQQMDSGFILERDSGFQKLDSGFQCPLFRVPRAKISRIPESGLLFDLIIVMIRHGWFCRPCFFGKSQRIQSSFHWHKSSWSQLYHERNSVRQGFLLNELNYPLHLCSWSNISFVT